MELPSKASIEKVSMEILRQSKALDVFPTPVDKIIEFTELKLDKTIDLSQIEKSFIDKMSERVEEKFRLTMNKIRGILDRQDRTIYLDLSMSFNRQNFVKLHEVGHDALTWQNHILQACAENDQTLDLDALDEFEAEANCFASTTLFQLDRFETEMHRLELGVKTPLALSKKFGGSFHAAIRRYVECSRHRCALLVLENVSKKGEVPNCSKRNFFASHSFTATFGKIDLPNEFGYTWDFVKHYYYKRRLTEKQDISLVTENGEASFTYDFFNNYYNAFVFIRPIGEFNSSKTKIILQA